MAFVDKCFGGPADGLELDEGVGLGVGRMLEPMTGIEYVRFAEWDTPGVHAWVPAAVSLNAPHELTVQVGRGESLTLDQLGSLVDGARRMGLPGSSSVSVLLRMSGRVRSVTVSPK